MNNLDFTAVDTNKLYQHILKLEGIRHPLINYQALEDARKYIVNEFQKLGYQVNQQEFKMEGINDSFYNIEASLDPNADKHFLVTSHYDTVMSSPGANDNASAVAVMLEVANAIKSQAFAKSIKFVCFTLEENNPSHQLKVRSKARELGLTDENHKPVSLSFLQNRQSFSENFFINRARGSQKIFDDTLKEMKDHLSETEIEFFTFEYGYFRNVSKNYFDLALIGSAKYVEQIDKDKIFGLLNFDCIGYTNKTPNSQTLLKGIDTAQLPKHNTADDLTIADFAFIMSEGNSLQIGQNFLEAAKHPSINLASTWLHLPFSFDQIAQSIPDVLRSDHSPFWKIGIPGIFVSDTANFRNENYHRPGDTYDTLDYEFMRQVSMATTLFLLKTIMNYV